VTEEVSRPKPPRFVLPALLALFALSAIVTALLARGWLAADRPEPPPEISALPDFELTNRDGRSVRLADLDGEIWVADFIFTRCGGVCPRMTERMIRLETSVGGTRLRRVSISVDPTFDTPDVLAAYAEAFRITDPDWLFLTGERDAIYELTVGGFKLAVDDEPPPQSTHPDEPILHSNRFVLVDRRGTIRGYYDPFRPEELQRLLRDANQLSSP